MNAIFTETCKFEDSPYYVRDCTCDACMNLKGNIIEFEPGMSIYDVRIVGPKEGNDEPMKPVFTPNYEDLFTVMTFPTNVVRACKAIRQATGCSLYVAKYIVKDYWMERNKRAKSYDMEGNDKEFVYPSITPHAMLRSFEGFMEQFVEVMPMIKEATDVSKDVLAAEILFKELRDKVQAMGLGWDMRRAIDELGFIEQSERDTPEFNFDNEVPY